MPEPANGGGEGRGLTSHAGWNHGGRKGLLAQEAAASRPPGALKGPGNTAR